MGDLSGLGEVCGTVDLLRQARWASRPGSRVPHTVVVLPSYSLSDSLLERFADRLPALEHRQLLTLLMLPQVPGARAVFVTCRHPTRQVLDYYLSLVPPEQRTAMRARIRVVVVPDPTARSLSVKLLERPDLLARIADLARGTLTYIEPWNVTAPEVEVARRLRLPLNGTPPQLWPLGFKSAGRTIMRQAGVPVPRGREHVRTVEDVVDAAELVRSRNRLAVGVVVKTDNGATGHGNRVLRFAELPGPERLREAVWSLGPGYLRELAGGGVVEELVTGPGFACPSVQLDIEPGGPVEVIATHEQELGGCDGQLYIGCRFPANPSYSTALARHGRAVGEALAARGAVGRLSIDFAAVQPRPGTWDLYGLEINLRTSGTNHPLAALRSLVPGRYDAERGRWLGHDGCSRSYRSTDNLHDPSWRGRRVREVIGTIRSAGLEFDRRTRTGVVLHMLSGLGIDGRIGVTAVGATPAESDRIYDAAVRVLSAPAGGERGAGAGRDPHRPAAVG